MLRFFLVFFFSLNLLYGCKFQWQYGKSADGCLIVDGTKREFRYFIPEHAKGVVLPLVIGLHGGDGNPKRFEKYSRFTQLSRQSGSFIMVYPKGLNKAWNDGRKSKAKGVDDVKFISVLMNLLPHVDQEEVYVSGMSNGGLMSQKLACEIPQKLKGIAIVSATMPQELYQSCHTRHPLDVMLIFGDKETVFLDDGKLVSPINQQQIRAKHIGITSTLQYWQRRNQCSQPRIIKTLDRFNKKWGKYKDDGTKVVISEYQNCTKRLRFYDIKGGGHRWPDKEASNGFMVKKVFNTGNASHEISTAEEFIEFFHLIKK